VAGRISRFLHIEKPRERGDEAAPVATQGRFGPEAPAPAAPEPPAPEPQPEPPRRDLRPDIPSLPVAEQEPAGAQPFQRCAACEADSSRFAQRCRNCGALFDTPEQRAFNERLWAQRREEAAETDAELARLEGLRADEEARRKEQRAMGEQLALEVGQRERARLHWMPDPEEEGRRESTGMRLLRMIPSTRARLIVSIALLLVGCAFAWAFISGAGGMRGWAFLFFWVIVLLFVPRGRRRFFR